MALSISFEKQLRLIRYEIHIKQEFPLEKNAVFSRKELHELIIYKTL